MLKAKAKWAEPLIHLTGQPVLIRLLLTFSIQHAELAKRLLIRSIKTNGSGDAAKARASKGLAQLHPGAAGGKSQTARYESGAGFFLASVVLLAAVSNVTAAINKQLYAMHSGVLCLSLLPAMCCSLSLPASPPPFPC